MYDIVNKTLYFNSDFNSPLTEVTFPSDIHKITFNIRFNQEVNNLLPNHVTKITFNFAFNRDISKLPINLKYLYLGYTFNQELNNLPVSLKCLSTSGSFKRSISKLPKCLVILYINRIIHSLNPYLYHLIKFHIYNYEYHKHTNIMIDRCRVNKHNKHIRSDKLINLLIKID